MTCDRCGKSTNIHHHVDVQHRGAVHGMQGRRAAAARLQAGGAGRRGSDPVGQLHLQRNRISQAMTLTEKVVLWITIFFVVLALLDRCG